MTHLQIKDFEDEEPDDSRVLCSLACGIRDTKRSLASGRVVDGCIAIPCEQEKCEKMIENVIRCKISN